jgi:hypothetical protein
VNGGRDRRARSSSRARRLALGRTGAVVTVLVLGARVAGFRRLRLQRDQLRLERRGVRHPLVMLAYPYLAAVDFLFGV